jgi:hypothetical protein
MVLKNQNLPGRSLYGKFWSTISASPKNKLWLVKWLIDEPPRGTWGNRERR